MFEKNNRYKLLKVFLENPLDNFRLRELSRIVKLSPPSVMAYLKEFDNEELVIKFEKRGIPFYKANRENDGFIVYKKLSIIYELYSSGIIDYLWEKAAPEAIILYGSYVNLMTDSVKNIPNELKNNLINGVVLKGYFKVF